MARPINPDRRDHQVKFRFTLDEYARLAKHAEREGKTLTDWGRQHLLTRRKSRAKNLDSSVMLVELSREHLRHWHDMGEHLNAIAHAVNTFDGPPPSDLPKCLAEIRAAARAQFAGLVTPAPDRPAYRLSKATYHQLKRIAVNLVQIRQRLARLKFPEPDGLSRLSDALARLLVGGGAP